VTAPVAARDEIKKDEVAAVASEESQQPPETKQNIDGQQEIAVARQPEEYRIEATNIPLKGIDLNLGSLVGIGQNLGENLKRSRACFRKGTIKSWFCTVDAKWPDEIRDKLATNSLLYRGEKLVVRYDQEKISRIFLLFRSQEFSKIVAHFVERYGAPTRKIEKFTNLSVDIPKLNRKFSWKSIDATKDNKSTFLEIGNIDDVRASSLDSKFGIVRIYVEGSEPIFKYVSEVDFILRM
jgi:hypothetical protein